MRFDEEYVLKALVSEYGGHYIDGEDPPDGYIINKGKIAVEVSMIIEHLQDKDGKRYSRMKDDVPASDLAKNVEIKIGASIPEGTHISLIIGAPVNNVRKTQDLIANAILQMIEEEKRNADLTICENMVSISLYENWREDSQKVGSIISNRYSSSNICENLEFLLHERITAKEKKRSMRPEIDEYWLALLNTYWVASENSFMQAYKKINVSHGFDKIFIVDTSGQTFLLC